MRGGVKPSKMLSVLAFVGYGMDPNIATPTKRGRSRAPSMNKAVLMIRSRQKSLSIGIYLEAPFLLINQQAED